jgi:hypothetical protein
MPGPADDFCFVENGRKKKVSQKQNRTRLHLITPRARRKFHFRYHNPRNLVSNRPESGEEVTLGGLLPPNPIRGLTFSQRSDSEVSFHCDQALFVPLQPVQD